MNFRSASGKSYFLVSAQIGSGGEGDIYPVQGAGNQVAKIYKAGAMTQELGKIYKYPPPGRVVKGGFASLYEIERISFGVVLFSC